ncbi:MAG: sn-glycerol-1-phosphate dehydrogenase [Clostridia bacterium]|nr:sn-glycerol-1-phosphate dehydrogenase [Clostridia bacterium]
MSFANLPINELLNEKGFECECGQKHYTDLRYVEIGQGAINKLPEVLKKCGATRPFIVSDKNTYAAAGKQAEEILKAAGIPFTSYVFPQEVITPSEFEVGQVVMEWDTNCDFIIAVGGGVINDVCKMVAKVSGLRQLILGTAPSMDGFASNSGSMIHDGIKVTIYTPCPVAIIADTEIMRNAPMLLLQAGLGDMLAKYVSVCEWRISNIITGEYFCPEIAQLMRNAVKKIVENADKLASRDADAVGAVVEGLILSGLAMGFAKVSRPASGLEHYFSHIWEMYALEKHTPESLHGIQVGIGTYLTLGIYDKLKLYKPDEKLALEYVEKFDPVFWESEMHRMFGSIADSVLAIEAKVQKNSKTTHPKRLRHIIDKWDEIVAAMNEELPSQAQIKAILESAGSPIVPKDIGIENDEVRDSLMASKEIRDKYIASRLLWDLGLLDKYADELVEGL